MKNLDVRNPWDNKVFDTIKTESERKLKLSFLLLMVSLKKRIISIYKRIEILENLKDLIKKTMINLFFKRQKRAEK